MNGKATTLKLLNVSRMAAHEIALHLKDKDTPRRGDLLSPTLSNLGECLIWGYRQFLTSTIIPFLPNHEIDAAFEKLGTAWEEVFRALSTALPNETYCNLVKAWRSANDALGAILRREHKPPRSEELCAELERRLEQAAKDFLGGDLRTGDSGKKPGRKRKGKSGRPKSQDKEDQVNDALIWLQNHSGMTPPQAANYIYWVDEVRNKYPNGYKRPPQGTKSRDDSFVKAIYRALKALPKVQHRTV